MACRQRLGWRGFCRYRAGYARWSYGSSLKAPTARLSSAVKRIDPGKQRGSIRLGRCARNAQRADGHYPKLALGVEVERCFVHCGKAFIRSGLWEPATWPDLDEVPTGARMLRDHRDNQTLEEVEAYMRRSYTELLWNSMPD